jgi:hypothetical protein
LGQFFTPNTYSEHLYCINKLNFKIFTLILQLKRLELEKELITVINWNSMMQ